MNRGTMRTLLRRELRDVAQVQWPTNADLDDILNYSYSVIQKEIRKHFKEAHLFWDYMNLVAGTSWYPLPQTFGISQVSAKGASTDTYYTPLKYKRYRDIGPRQIISGGSLVTQIIGTQMNYTRRGQWIGLFPAPTVSITSGLEVMHSPIMSMGSDDEIARIKVPLHLAIVLHAKLVALGETDADETASTLQRLGEIVNDLGEWYDESSDAEEILQVEMP